MRNGRMSFAAGSSVPRSSFLVRLAALLLFSLCLSCQSAPKRRDPSLALTRHEFTAEQAGRPIRLTFYAPDAAAAQSAADEAFARADAIADVIDARRADSELARLNETAGGPPIIGLSDELFRLLLEVDALSRRSGGAFDPTVGPLADLWRQTRATGRFPAKELLDAARAHVGRDKFVIEPIERTVQLVEPGMRLDLDMLANGYTADQLMAVLRRRGIDRALVEVGDTVLLSGPPPGTAGWRIELLGVPPKSPQRVVTLANVALSTAGREEATVQIAGQRFAEVIDPATGLGVTGGLAVTVIARNGLAADALAAAALVLGPQKSRLLLLSARAGAYFRRGATAVEVNPPATQPSGEGDPG